MHQGRDDATTGVELIEAVNDDIASVTADAAYDTVGCYDAAGARGATGVVPPTKTARVSRRRPRASARDHTINTVKSIGRRRWKQTSRDHQQARVENACFRYQSIIADGLRARTPGGRTGRSAARVQYAECDDRHGPPSFLRRRSMKHRWLGPWRASFDSCTNATEWRGSEGCHPPGAGFERSYGPSGRRRSDTPAGSTLEIWLTQCSHVRYCTILT